MESSCTHCQLNSRRAVITLLLLTAALCHAQNTRVVLLGTGNPNPDPDRMGPAVAILSGNSVYLVDAGTGVVRRAVQAGIAMRQLTRAFLTHLHSDHTIGLPDLMFTPAINGRMQGIDIYGPPGTHAMIDFIQKAWTQDQDIRLHGLEPSVPRAYEIHAKDIQAGEVYRDASIRVIAFEVKHGTWAHAFGYRFEASDKTIVLSGDTTYTDAVIKAARGCDILVHEVYSQKGLARRTPEWQRYHKAFHTSGPDLGRLAETVHPKKLVLYHQLPMGETPDEVVQEIRTHFHGEVIYGNDLDIIR